mgnify:CR=1 FL=1|jgi:hypothetical protein
MTGFLGVLEKTIENKRFAWVFFIFSLAFICSVPVLRNIVRSDDALDKTVIVVWLFLFVSFSVIAVDFVSLWIRRIGSWFEARGRQSSNRKLLSELSKDEILFLREFVVLDSHIIRVKISTSNRTVHNLCKKKIISSLDLAVFVNDESYRYTIEDEFSDIIFNNSEILFDGIPWCRMSDEQKMNVEKERPDYTRFSDWE